MDLRITCFTDAAFAVIDVACPLQQNKVLGERLQLEARFRVYHNNMQLSFDRSYLYLVSTLLPLGLLRVTYGSCHDVFKGVLLPTDC